MCALSNYHALAQPTVTRTQTEQHYDLPLISNSASRVIDHLFTIHNVDTKTPILIDRVVPSCGCTSSVVLAQPGSKAMVVPPGKDIYVVVSIDPRLLTPGPFTKSVSVYVKGRREPLVQLDMRGNFLPGAKFLPAVLNLGVCTAGSEHIVTFSATIDPNLLPAGMVTRLQSTDPDLTITVSSASSKIQNTTNYTAQLSPSAYLGPISGRITMLLESTAAGGKKTEYPAGSLPVLGAVIGDISIVPSVISFGTVKAGTIGEQILAVTSTTPDNVTGLTYSSSDQNLTISTDTKVTNNLAHLNRSFGSPLTDTKSSPVQPRTAIVRIVLGAGVRPGPFQGVVTVATRGNERLKIPVYAHVLGY